MVMLAYMGFAFHRLILSPWLQTALVRRYHHLFVIVLADSGAMHKPLDLLITLVKAPPINALKV